jgi:drug/metabolite transporter (DMT)-like permease
MADAHPKSPSRSVLVPGLLAGVLAASTAAIFIRFAQAEGAASIVIAAARLTIASLILAPLALTRYRSDMKLLKRGEWMLALLSGFFLALHFATWITSLEFTSVASSVVLVTTTPLWVALLAPLVLRERITTYAIIGMILALAGGIVIGLSDACTWNAGAVVCPPLRSFVEGKAFLGDCLALFGAWMAAGYILMGRKLRSKLSLVPYIFVVYGMAAAVLIVIMLGTGKSPLGLPALAYLWFLLLALIPQLIGHSTFNWALKYLPASFVSVTLLGEPIGSTVLAYIIFQETPGWVKIGGAVLILAGIWLAAMPEKRRSSL